MSNIEKQVVSTSWSQKPVLLVRCAATAMSLALSGCGSLNFGTKPVAFGSVDGIATTGGIRLITERSRTDIDGNRVPIVCTEPSPDYAVGITKKATVSGEGTIPTVVAGAAASEILKANVDTSSEEKIEKLEGRKAGVLALRDGLYAACQSYANGIIGQDAYAIILSQYGALLVALTADAPSNGARAAAAGAKEAALATLIVACINRSDPSRGPPYTLGRHTGPVLSPAFCNQVLQRALDYAVRG
ncbi:MAG: hypothetical protein K2X57_29195 [Xanthobacteraceae bacterium]|nr:hypothetical protein [Xanthobacteraceae bacterium]